MWCLYNKTWPYKNIIISNIIIIMSIIIMLKNNTISSTAEQSLIWGVTWLLSRNTDGLSVETDQTKHCRWEIRDRLETFCVPFHVKGCHVRWIFTLLQKRTIWRFGMRTGSQDSNNPQKSQVWHLVVKQECGWENGGVNNTWDYTNQVYPKQSIKINNS